MHGYIELFIAGQWVKATPAFNAALCETMNVEPLEFDGYHDSVFQAYTASGDAHMEYVADHGVFPDVPHEFIVSGIRSAYSHLFDHEGNATGFSGSLERDIANRRSAPQTT
ncbi:hypothetical protein C8D92_10817 [Tamilnaduibacter salinus]|uniref:Uncharacterized protein n=1 Tax=Tamilnaduibacter salinus TaxID=1484056 RepID=A0A2U1CUL3_9GAMM|nr:hypothetical protein [Tamilnaduibacter salinus]PVY70661.1 hypothetical protein C8D92_10817 [Tamilnaduibacter salinus]